MPISYRIDPERRLLFIQGTETLSAADLIDLRDRLMNEKSLTPGFNRLFDFRRITRHELSGDDIRTILTSSHFGAPERRAVVVSQDVTFGIIRMFSAYAKDDVGSMIRVFRDFEEACTWLGIDPVEAEKEFR